MAEYMNWITPPSVVARGGGGDYFHTLSDYRLQGGEKCLPGG
jgi:hypothetical protein